MFTTAKTYLSEIKFAHTLFAMPFALAGAALAFAECSHPPLAFIIIKLILIIVAMIAARSAAMMFNRIADRPFDAANPRTSSRALVTGRISLRAAWLFVASSSALFIIAATLLNPLALALSPAALAIVLAYSYTKRFTALTHFFLGLSLSLAPIGAWIAVLGAFGPFQIPALLAAAVILWTAGFDIIYACQDYKIDLASPLHSIPKSFGVPNALIISALLHAGAVALLIALLIASPHLGMIFAAGIIIIAALLFWEHLIIRPSDLSRINTAFLTLNALISLILLLSITLDTLV
jgi:4-hydroxybenzoate polyprenyltransferase